MMGIELFLPNVQEQVAIGDFLTGIDNLKISAILNTGSFSSIIYATFRGITT